jgi:hypothetical protein
MNKHLDEEGILESLGQGRYRLNLDDLPEKIFEYRVDKEEFTMDQKMKERVKEARKRYADYAEVFVHQKGTWAEHTQRREAFRRLIANRGTNAPNKSEEKIEHEEVVKSGGRK